MSLGIGTKTTGISLDLETRACYETLIKHDIEVRPSAVFKQALFDMVKEAELADEAEKLYRSQKGPEKNIKIFD